MYFIKNKTKIIQSKIKYSRSVKSDCPSNILADVPYFAQWESRDLIMSIFTHKISPKEDPKWILSGAKSPSEYDAWSGIACGLACTKMIVAGELIPIVELVKRSLSYGVYTQPLSESEGLTYQPYTMFLKKEFDLDATSVVPLVVEQIIYELSHGNYVMASVSRHIYQTPKKPPYKGAHLVLILGYNLNKKELIFHNPAGTTYATQEYSAISFSDFKRFFDHKGLTIKSRQSFRLPL